VGLSVIGILDIRSPDAMTDRLRTFRQGLKEIGYVEGENVTIEYHSAENQIDRLPALAADLVRRRVTVIAATGGPPSALAAQAATTTIPIVFVTAEDPVRLGLVASLARPGGNLTGVSMLTAELAAKRLELLRGLVPGAVRMAVFANPNNPAADIRLRELDAAARSMGLQIQVLSTSTSREIDAAFATFVRERPDALFVSPDGFFNGRRVQLVLLAAFHRVPAAFASREYAEAGGLMSYGTNFADAFRQLGVYAGRILKGTKPADLPVVQSSKFELVIDHQIARMLGLTVPDKLLVAADEVIE
jgi:putative ABC transport system substrate-binding protein